MRLKGRQLRFLLLAFGLWTGMRLWQLWPVGERRTEIAERGAARTGPLATASIPHFVRPEPVEGLSFPYPPLLGKRTGLRQARRERDGGDLRSSVLIITQEPKRVDIATAQSSSSRARSPDALVASASTVSASSPRHDWEAEAYLFYRPDGHQTSLAAGGQLGGSQLAARVAWRVGGGPIGLALRAYAPLGEKGAEAAAGIDWHPFGDAPVRFSIERRQRLDREGRSAWSAYAAGGFYRAKGPAEFDGYAQAGLVGTQRRDGFVDGALRIGYRLPTGGIVPILGVGVWGAAQPGVARLDVGPRAALRVPVGAHIVTASIDGRFRLAGGARPGSGAALTLAADW